MEETESIHPTSRETCLGLPFVEERPISEEERVALRREARQSMGRSFAWGCSAPFVFLIVMVTAGSVFPDNSDAALLRMIPGIIIMILAFGLPAAFFLKANDRYKLLKVAKKDLYDGIIKCYQGFAPGIDRNNAPEIDSNPEPKKKIAGVDISVFKPITLEVFCSSRRLWQVNGIRVKKVVCLPEEHTAFQPKQAQTAAKWVEPARIIADHTIDVSQSGQRDLSEQETDEIHRHARTDWRRPGLGALAFTAYFGTLAIRQWQGDSGVILQWSAYIFIALIIWTDIKFAKIALRSWQLSRDVILGIVIITRYPDDMNGEEVLRKGDVAEWLPHSNAKWNINGEPAPWRLRR